MADTATPISPVPPNSAPPNPEVTYPDGVSPESRKWLFVGLVAGTALPVCLVLVVLGFVPGLGLRHVHPYAPLAWGAPFAILLLLVLWAALGLVLNVLCGRSVLIPPKLLGMVIRLFLPPMTLVGRILGKSKDEVRSSFINVNNELVKGTEKTFLPQEVLVLLPHCLQNSECTIRLTHDIANCRRCGKCCIMNILELCQRYGVHVSVVTGGTVARRIVKEKRPKLVLAVACERDLASGIQDTFPLTVYGVVNERPNGPCFNTQVSIPRLEQAFQRFLSSVPPEPETGQTP
jgi:uncharacterized protein